MPSATLSTQDLQEICQRYLKLYSGAIADILDKRGHRNQVLPRYLTPLTTVNRLPGLAFTGQGYPRANAADDDTQPRLNMLDSITPGTVSVWACGGSVNCAHWGEMMSTAAQTVKVHVRVRRTGGQANGRQRSETAHQRGAGSASRAGSRVRTPGRRDTAQLAGLEGMA